MTIQTQFLILSLTSIFIDEPPLTVDVAELLGAETNIYATIGKDSIIASVPCRDDLKKGSHVKLAFNMEHCHVFDVETEMAVF